MKTLCLLFLVLFSTCALAQNVPILPLDKVDPDAVLTKQATERPHVLFVNVDKALDDARFREAVAAVALIEPVNLAVTEQKGALDLNALAKDDANKRFSKQVKLVIYVVNKPDMASYLQAPGAWALVNLNRLDKGLPKDDPERYRRRLRQIMLKGLAQACGVGATHDQRCVMFQSSFTAEGMDKTSVSYSLFAGGPVQDILLAIGGPEIMMPMPE